jgi:hypothetical protein
LAYYICIYWRWTLQVNSRKDRAKFNGSAPVEWLNISAGGDGAPDWNTTHREILRQGYAYVAVSAQRVGSYGRHA